MRRKPPTPKPYNPPVTPLRVSTIAIATALLPACGPSVEALDDVYPRNCGVEGPVDLFDNATPSSVDVRRAGTHYLIEHWPSPESREHWAVDRCGESQVLLHTSGPDSSLRFGTAGDHLLSCDESTGAIAFIDPTGIAPPRPLFPAVEGCRVVSLGKGLAAQEKQGSTVWFHPDPADPEQEPLVVTHDARVADPDFADCWSLQLDCDAYHPFGLNIRPAGDELLVALASEELLAFSSASLASRILDPGPVFAMDVLSDERHIVVERHFGPTLVVDRQTGDSLDFCCWNGDFAPIQMFGDWIVQGSYGNLVNPEPSESEVFEAYHLPSGAHTLIEGHDAWEPFARITDDTVLVEIGPDENDEESRHVVWLTTGEQQPVDLPDDGIWAMPGQDGVYALDLTDDTLALHHLAGPGQAPRILVDDARMVYPTEHGRILFEHARAPLEPTQLSVMLPDERVVQLDDRSLGTFGPAFSSERQPLSHDEVLYLAKDGEGWALRRTVLP